MPQHECPMSGNFYFYFIFAGYSINLSQLTDFISPISNPFNIKKSQNPIQLKFETDRQTVEDIEIFDSKRTNNSIFNLFNSTKSVGGRNTLFRYLNKPLTDLIQITERRDAIRFFQETDCFSDLEIDKNSLDFIEHYLMQANYPTRPPSKFIAIEKAIKYRISPSNEYYIIERGIDYVIDLLNNVYDFTLKLEKYDCPSLIKQNNTKLWKLFSSPEFDKISKIRELRKLNAVDVASFDYMFRYTHKDVVRFFLDLIYEYDVLIGVSQVAVANAYTYPDILPEEAGVLHIEGLFHPFIPNSVKNTIHLTTTGTNLLFLTGPNMAGKSSILKALSVSVYLAHIGFPVPASGAKISLLSGLYTTINLSDNLTMGYSHFYSEVLRIKFIAERLKSNSNMLIVFDELFRGTNVKDAYDGSLAIISAFSKIRNCFFAISTHIIEIANELADRESILFRKMEVVSNENLPQYTYLMKDGVSDDRMGLYIIDKEKVLSIINSIT